MPIPRNTTAKRRVFFTILLIAVFLSITGPAGTLSSQVDIRSESVIGGPHCRVATGTLFSKARNKTTAYLAYIPENKNDIKYPILLLLHGAWDDYTAWNTHAQDRLCELADKHRIIIVTPDGDPFGWYADSPYIQENQIETYFMDELIPHLDRHLPSNGKMSIAGLSMGGHGALVLAMRNPHVFRSVSSMSGILDITRHPKSWKLSEVFGPYEENSALWREHSARFLADARADYLKELPILVTVSSGDKWAYEENRDFHEHLNVLGIPHRYQVDPGRHDWVYWLSRLAMHVEFHARRLGD